MAIMSSPAHKDFARILVYGEPKTRKTWWALKAVELGYNVTVLDFNNGLRIANKLDPKYLDRIYSLPCWAPAGAEYSVSAMPALTKASHGDTIYYDEETRRNVRKTGLVADQTYTKIDLTQAAPQDLIILDCWTDVCQMIAEFVAKRADVMKLPEYGLEQAEYNKRRMIADRFLAGLYTLNCPIIFIGHSVEWAKKRANAKPNAPAHEAIENISMLPGSVTYAHGQDFAAGMTDTLYFTTVASTSGDSTMISTKTGVTYLAGSRSVAPMNKTWDNMGVELFLPPCPNPTPKFETKIVESVKGSDVSVSSVGVLGAGNTPTLKGIGKLNL